MSFVRPEVAGWLRRWGEGFAAAAIFLLGLWLLYRGFSQYNWMSQAIGAILTLGGGLVFLAVAQRIRFYTADHGLGVVEVTERQITYLAYENGASVDLAALTRLELRTSLNHGRTWVLKQSEGPTIFIPTSAEGAEKLFDAFNTLPGFDPAHLVAALKSDSDQRDIIWRGKPGFRPVS